MEASFKIIVKTLAGLEEVLATEMRELGVADVEPGRRAVFCTGDLETIYKLNFHCRTALKVLRPVHEFTADTIDKVYHAVRSLDWEEYMDLNQTFAVDAVTFSEKFHHSKFVALRVKDAIADFFNKKYDKRPSVSVSNPHLRVNLHIADEQCTLSLDSSGESLHKRGWREAQTEAPINEVLAAGILLMAGWKGQSDFYDPMCGSGTFLVEAAMIAKGIAPGLYRQGFAFERWKDFDADKFEEIFHDESLEKEFEHNIYGSDISEMALKIAEKNIKQAGFAKEIRLKNIPFQDLEATERKGFMVMNPPYGDRLKVSQLTDFYGQIGERLKHRFTGYNAWIISHKKECFHAIGLKPSDKVDLFNGSLRCQLHHYETYEGSKKAPREEREQAEGDRPKRFDSDEKPKRFEERKPRGDKFEKRPDRKDGDRPFRGGDKFAKNDGFKGGRSNDREDNKDFKRKSSRNEDIQRLRKELNVKPTQRKDGKPKRPRI